MTDSERDMILSLVSTFLSRFSCLSTLALVIVCSCVRPTNILSILSTFIAVLLTVCLMSLVSSLTIPLTLFSSWNVSIVTLKQDRLVASTISHSRSVILEIAQDFCHNGGMRVDDKNNSENFDVAKVNGLVMSENPERESH